MAFIPGTQSVGASTDSGIGQTSNGTVANAALAGVQPGVNTDLTVGVGPVTPLSGAAGSSPTNLVTTQGSAPIVQLDTQNTVQNAFKPNA